MRVFIDTSAIIAILSESDKFHEKAKTQWRIIIESNAALFSSNYILIETTALLQRRFGIEAARLFVGSIQPLINITWVDETLHHLGLSLLQMNNQRDLSLVDCTSFEIMRRLQLDNAFTFDIHFTNQGFKVIPKI